MIELLKEKREKLEVNKACRGCGRDCRYTLPSVSKERNDLYSGLKLPCYIGNEVGK